MGSPERIFPEDDDLGTPPHAGGADSDRPVDAQGANDAMNDVAALPPVAGDTTRREDFEFDERATGSPIDDAERPSWLVGAEEGTDADFARAERDAGGPPDVRLNRPATVPDEDRAGSPRPTPVARPNDDQAHNGAAPLAGLPLSSRQAKPAADGAKGPGKAAAWAAASSSIPKLTAVPAAKAHPPTEEDFEDESAARTTGSLDDDDVAGAARSDVGPGEGGLRPLDEPWHVVLIERIATERKLQVLIGLAVVLVICTLVFWPHTGTSVSVKAIKLHPDGYEGQTVRVSGVVGEVFPVGQGYVYSLQQGRDTITVFARGHVPVTKQHVTVIGQVSTGYMDGRPRTAILEGDNP